MSSPVRRFFSWVGRLFTGSLGSKKSKIRLLAVGLENSRKFGACPGAGLDAQRIHEKVQAGKKVLLQSSQATKSAVTSALQEGVCGTSDDGLFIFYYSGHGGQVRDKSGDEEDGKDETFCLWDGELSDDTVWSVIQGAKCRVFMVTDCCNSGTNYRAAWIPFVKSSSCNPRKGLRLLHWGGCSDGTYSYGDSSGGVMTNSILKMIGSGASYKKTFSRAVSDSKGFQVPVKFNLGFDEDVEVFK